MGRRKSDSYSPEQIRGMRLVAQILRTARLNHPESSYRRFSSWLKTAHGENFNGSRIRIFELAGQVTDSRTGTINAINRIYLELLQPLTAFTLEELQELYQGKLVHLIEASNMTTIKELIDKRERELGAIAFKRKMIEVQLSQSDVDLARNGEISSHKVTLGLSSLLEIPADEVKLAAIAQLLKKEGDPDP